VNISKQFIFGIWFIPYLDAAAQERKPVTWQSTALISHLLGCSRETGPTVTNPVDDPPKRRIVERSEYSVCTMVIRIHPPRAEARMTRFVMLFSCSGVATRLAMPPSPTVPSDDSLAHGPLWPRALDHLSDLTVHGSKVMRERGPAG